MKLLIGFGALALFVVGLGALVWPALVWILTVWAMFEVAP